ncbi:MAG TPA: ribosome biogenesis/translation initiation ATPase RLI [candidate division Zixibacteria bacterium]|nr:ribosome biogenesis/translation initiation ATPase RLI [candidate division Zixibacteria bacterium]
MSKNAGNTKRTITRIPIVNLDRCQPASCGHACIKICPLNKKGRKVIYADKVHAKARIDTKKCIECGICVNRCPMHAIAMVGLPVELDETPIHQYGENSFRLYGLPFLAKGKVAGLIGANGIGKTTVLNILAGKLVPNAGEFDLEDLKWKDVFSTLNLSVHRSYFRSLIENKIKISFKEQVLTQFLDEKGTIDDVLEREDELGNKRRLIDELQLKTLLEKNFTQLSGGERQRFAIAIALAKDADVYLIDEPGNFLDIKQRLNLAKLFDNLAQQNKSVLVVEHDIAILDYLSDQIQALWGTPHAFGVVSGVKSVKAGINAYLTGHLKEENITFRNKAISFLRVVKERRWDNVPIYVKFTTLWKRFDNFKLKVSPGEVYKGETLVILGENGIGKTTFVKMLAGVLQPDKGSANVMAQVSYKPQFITREYKGTVNEFITNYSGRFTGEQVLKQTFYQPLGIEHLFDKKIMDLSGGELQRVYIAACLTKRADLYLIDEPAAFLDVEERIKVARIIRNAVSLYNASAIAIEHDMQLADVLGDRVLLFLGEPGLRGYTIGPMGKRDGMNEFLKTLDITFRRDTETGRARINKLGSKIDREQRESGEFFFER